MSYASFHKRIHEARLLGFLDIASYGEVVYSGQDKSGPPLLSMTEETYPNTQIRLSRPSYYVLTGLGRMAVREWDNLTKAVKETGYARLDTTEVKVMTVPPLVLPTQRITVTSAPGVARQLQELDALRVRVAPEDTNIHEALIDEIDTLRTSLSVWLQDLQERLQTPRVQQITSVREAITERLGKLQDLQAALGTQGTGFPDLGQAIQILGEIEPMQPPREAMPLPREPRQISRKPVSPREEIPEVEEWVVFRFDPDEEPWIPALAESFPEEIREAVAAQELEAPEEPWIVQVTGTEIQVHPAMRTIWFDRVTVERGRRG